MFSFLSDFKLPNLTHSTNTHYAEILQTVCHKWATVHISNIYTGCCNNNYNIISKVLVSILTGLSFDYISCVFFTIFTSHNQHCGLWILYLGCNISLHSIFLFVIYIIVSFFILYIFFSKFGLSFNTVTTGILFTKHV